MAAIQRDFMAIAPTTPFSSPSRRKITPKSERSLSSKSVLIARAGNLASTQLVPANHPLLSPSRRFLPKRSSVTKIGAVPAANPRHIILEEYDLRKDSSPFFVDGAMAPLMSIFPGIKHIHFDHYMLIFQMEQLPPKPWPKTVAGVACMLITMDQVPIAHPRLLSKRSTTQVRILDHLDARRPKKVSNTAFVEQHLGSIFAYFRSKNINVVQLQNWNHFFVLVLKDEDQRTNDLPLYIMRLPCYSLLKDDVFPAQEPALRLKEPNASIPGHYDDATYDVLRPGIMITSEELDEGQFTTTLGVMVQNAEGRKYVTAAAHGFPNLGPVYHPRGNGRLIGNVIYDFSPDFDVALIELEKGETFKNETFDTADDYKGSKPNGFLPSDSVQRGTVVHMDSPFMGRCSGQIESVSYTPTVMADDKEKSYWFTTGHWVWTGQDTGDELVDGICGTALLDDDHDMVVGFFRFVGKGELENLSYCVGAENLRRLHYGVTLE